MAPPTGQRIVIGLDVGKSAHWACVVTREGELLASGPIPNRENAINGLYDQHPGALVVWVAAARFASRRCTIGSAEDRADDEGDLASRDKGSDAGRDPANERIPPKGNDRPASP